jgi:hypothetical protein
LLEDLDLQEEDFGEVVVDDDNAEIWKAHAGSR